MEKKRKSGKRGEVLVALLKEPRDFAIVKDELWYRIPVKSKPRHWPPKWLAFYFPSAFGEDLKFSICYFGEVDEINTKTRRELFPNEIPNPNSDKPYFCIRLKSLQERAAPIISKRGRRVLFILTTWEKFKQADEINDLFTDSPLEDLLWSELKRLAIDAERQFELSLGKKVYQLDFAIFCKEGQLDVETDGDSYHTGTEKGNRDNLRNNALTAAGWQVLRFNTSQIREHMGSYTIPEIKKTINKLGGLETDGEVTRKFFETPFGSAQQLMLFGEMDTKSDKRLI